ncbi:unnamed protein product (macronuclear) [Paramecium tetraurelia]|uniref:Uncharacterized protein n=1 Tax=Paramecium tetraurelia TaxID=5888 RepID=A0D950_PARTE|nr:uncharacterized protein GSPATT00014513001 [Paramecium tetraurelia]CAK79567.1 unnamed protein product [Paramecium tetraurelia]|eukprot:XP_001446964.1 hypothetical protein (macronuclear) [Paramecium tetraurelia strain d4-2]
MNNDIYQSMNLQIDSHIQQNEKGTPNNQRPRNSLIDQLFKSNEKNQSTPIVDSFNDLRFQDAQYEVTPRQDFEIRGHDNQHITFRSEKKQNQQKNKYFHSPSKQCEGDLRHKQQIQVDEEQTDLQEQRKQKIRELEQKIQQAQRKIEEKEGQIKANQEIIINFESFILKDYNPEEFEKIILSESNFVTDNILINNLISQLKSFLSEFQNSIIDLIKKFDGKVKLDKDGEGKDFQQNSHLIIKEFQKFAEKQQKNVISDNKSTNTIQEISESEKKLSNQEFNLLVSNIITQTKQLRDIIQKSCCLLIKFNCEMYNGLQGMSKSIKQLEQIQSITNSVKLKTQYFQSIINDQINLQITSDDNDHLLLLDLLKQLIHKQEQAFQFQQFFAESLFKRIDLVHQSEDNLREDMAKRLQSFK